MYEAGRGVGRDIGDVIYWYRKAAEQGQADAQEVLAWIYATASDERHRNGSKAVKFARLAVAQEDSAYNRDTLAAAYAETGDFPSAVREQERAIEILRRAGEVDLIANYEGRLGLYRQGQPYRE